MRRWSYGGDNESTDCNALCSRLKQTLLDSWSMLIRRARDAPITKLEYIGLLRIYEAFIANMFMKRCKYIESARYQLLLEHKRKTEAGFILGKEAQVWGTYRNFRKQQVREQRSE